MTTPIIDSFSKQHRFLSNFWPCDVYYEGQLYPSVEHAYQSAKSSGENWRRFMDITPNQAKRLGNEIPLREDWYDVRVGVMDALLRQKFAPGTELRRMLDETAPSELVEGNTWGDVFWGVCRGEGKNVLGQLLMAIRKGGRK